MHKMYNNSPIYKSCLASNTFSLITDMTVYKTIKYELFRKNLKVFKHNFKKIMISSQNIKREIFYYAN